MSDAYSPPQSARILGGVQWAITAMIVMNTIGSMCLTYLSTTRTGYLTFSYAWEATVVMAVAFAMGYLWVIRHTKNEQQETRANRQRIDYLLLMWLGWPFVLFGLENPFQILDINVLNRPYLDHAVSGFGAVLFPVLVVYYLETEVFVRFKSR